MRALLALLAFALLAPAASAQSPPTPAPGVTVSHGFTVLGTPKLPADYKNFTYVNPDAPKGGTVTLAALGSYDSFNPFIIRGTSAAGLQDVYDTLLRPSAEEVATAYGLVAETIEVPADKSWIAFNLRKEARFNDGTPVTADDVAWSFKTLRDQGRPFYRQYYGAITDVTVEGPLPRRLPREIRRGQPRAAAHPRRAAGAAGALVQGARLLAPAHRAAARLGAVPRRPPSISAAASPTSACRITGRANLPVARGFNNFGEIRQEYYRDSTVAMQAFKAGEIDFRQENIAKNWATAYDFPAVQKGMVVKESDPASSSGRACRAGR